MFSGICLAVAMGTAYAGGLAASGYVQQIETIKNTGASNTVTVKLYWKNDSLRVERYTIDGLRVEIKKGRELYEYLPSQKAAMKIVLPESQSQTVEQIMLSKASVVKSGKKVGSAKVNGFPCDVYTGGEGGRSGKVYLSTDSRFPLPLKMEISSGSASQITETTEVKLNTAVSDSMFTLPKGTTVKTQSLNAPKAPKRSAAHKRR